MAFEFEWHESKRRKNVEKHGVDFTTVLPLFGTKGVLQMEDRRRDYGERRYILMGELRGMLFHVTCTCRGNAIRIISARRANQRERKRYEQYRRTLDPSRTH